MNAHSNNAGPGWHRFQTVCRMLSSMQEACRAVRRDRDMAFLIAAFAGVPGVLQTAPVNISFSQSAVSVDAYNFVEVTVHVTSPDVMNPFTEAGVTGQFEAAGQAPTQVNGFCDSKDGSVFRIRFMPIKPGE